MFIKSEIPTNFNGFITLEQDTYFFNVNHNLLRVFYNINEPQTAASFRKKYADIIKKNFIYGQCSDNKRVIFIIENENYSSCPNSYSEFQIIACVKEIHFSLYDYNNEINISSKKRKAAIIKDIDTFDQIIISGNIINSISPQMGYATDMETLLIFGEPIIEKPTVIQPKEINLTDNIKCFFSTERILNQQIANGIIYDTNILFSFKEEQRIDSFLSYFFAIKQFIDFMVLARNTEFEIYLAKNLDGRKIKYAKVKIYNKFNNICNKSNLCVLNLEILQDHISDIFYNLNNKCKYSLIYLPIDNSQNGIIGYTDIQQLITAIDLACGLKLKMKENKIKTKAQVLYEWCEPWLEIFDIEFKIDEKKIAKFRKTRNNITHDAYAVITKETYYCFIALKTILYIHTMELDPEDDMSLACHIYYRIKKLI